MWFLFLYINSPVYFFLCSVISISLRASINRSYLWFFTREVLISQSNTLISWYCATKCSVCKFLCIITYLFVIAQRMDERPTSPGIHDRYVTVIFVRFHSAAISRLIKLNSNYNYDVLRSRNYMSSSFLTVEESGTNCDKRRFWHTKVVRKIN